MSAPDIVQLSPHFTLAELTVTNTGLPNIPNLNEIERLIWLCENLLEPIRAKLGKPIRITSGFRNVHVNKKVGGAKNSEHLTGQAADINVDGMSPNELFYFIKDHFNYNQLILEPTWVHISWAGANNRNMNLKAERVKGKMKYTAI